MRAFRDKKLMMLRPSQIKQPNSQTAAYSPLQLAALTGSIAANGIIEPLLVKKEKDGTYLLLSGGKRLYCAKTVGLRRIPCIVCRADNISAGLFGLSSNLCRYEAPFFEQARQIRDIMKKSGLTQRELAARLGVSPCAIENKLRLLTLSDTVSGQITHHNLSEASARILCRISPENQERLITKIAREGLTARQLEEEICNLIYEADNPQNITFYEEKTEEPKLKKKISVGDKIFFKNSLIRLVSLADEAGLRPSFKTVETEKYTEYKIRINKQNVPCFEQLKIV